MTSKLGQFLARNSVDGVEGLPLVHSTKSYDLRAILSGGSLIPQPCDVFKGESLTYFFVGRPAYKHKSDSGRAEPWELPCCFIFEAHAVVPKRVFPFDSGAFKAKRYPSYIRDMPLKAFEVGTPDAPNKIIGAYFGSARKYFDLHSKARDVFENEYSLNPLDHSEISALIRLAGEDTPTKFDDRRLTIEVQTDTAIPLQGTKPLAVVLPEIYLDIPEVLNKVQNDWGAEPIGYPLFPLSLNSYYAIIYKSVRDFYERKGFL